MRPRNSVVSKFPEHRDVESIAAVADEFRRSWCKLRLKCLQISTTAIDNSLLPSSKAMPEQQLYDYGNNFIRTQLATVQGAAVPLPFGGKG